MAEYSKKKITDLTEKTAPSDSDLFVAGNNGTATMRKMSFANIVSGIIGKLTGAVSSILTSNLTASRALISNSSGKVAASGVSSTELGYLSGASSNIQSQLSALNSKFLKLPMTAVSGLTTEQLIDAAYINAHGNAADRSYYRTLLDHGAAHSVLAGGRYYLEGYRDSSNYGWQRTTTYATSGVKSFVRSIYNGTWGSWVKIS